MRCDKNLYSLCKNKYTSLDRNFRRNADAFAELTAEIMYYAHMAYV